MKAASVRQRGVTLIEQAIGLVVTAIVLALGLPDYTDYIQNRNVRSNAEAIVDGLQLTRLEAVRRNEAVDFRLTGNDWSIVVVGSGETVQSRSSMESRQSRVLAQNSTTTITFNGLGRITSGNAGNVFSVSHVSGSCAPADRYRCFQVQATTGGQVRMCDPQLASGDPQACS